MTLTIWYLPSDPETQTPDPEIDPGLTFKSQILPPNHHFSNLRFSFKPCKPNISRILSNNKRSLSFRYVGFQE